MEKKKKNRLIKALLSSVIVGKLFCLSFLAVNQTSAAVTATSLMLHEIREMRKVGVTAYFLTCYLVCN